MDVETETGTTGGVTIELTVPEHWEKITDSNGAVIGFRLPDDVTLEDIQYHLDVVIKVLEAEASDPRDDIPHEEMKRQFAKWLAE